jgi:ribosomal protein S6--L-glutamate ligase
MKFLILSRIPELYSTRRFVQELAARNHEYSVENPDGAYAAVPADVVIPRLGNYRYEESIASVFQYVATHPGARVLNPPADFHRARHKLLALRALRDLPQPELWSGPSRYPVVLKDCLSSQGEGVFLCQDADELGACLAKLQNREVLYQEFIRESAGRDVRAFTIGPRVAAAIERRSSDPGREFRSNLALGGQAFRTSLSPAEEALCLRAVKILNLDYAGVDFVRSDRGPLILEVNPCPGFEGVENCTGENLAQEVVLYAESLFGSNSAR